MSLLDSLFKSRDKNKTTQNHNSGSVAKERLQLALAYDRVKISPELLDTIKNEIIAVISKHFEVDQNAIEVSLGERNDILIANIPVRRTRQLNPRP